jgi:hypothetical protein
LVVGGGSTMAMEEEAATEAAEEVGNGPGGWPLCSIVYFSPIFFLTVTTAATEGQGGVVVSSREAHSGRVVLIVFVNVLSLVLALASLFLLSSSPFLLLLLFTPPSPSPLLRSHLNHPRPPSDLNLAGISMFSRSHLWRRRRCRGRRCHAHILLPSPFILTAEISLESPRSLSSRTHVIIQLIS